MDKICEDAGPSIEGGKYGSEEGAKDVEDGRDKGGDGGGNGRHFASATRDFTLSGFVCIIWIGESNQLNFEVSGTYGILRLGTGTRSWNA